MSDLIPDRKLLPVLGYLGVVRESLRMQNWDIVLHRTDLQEADTWASTWSSKNHSTINIEIARCLPDSSPSLVRNTLVHEMIHSQHRDLSLLWEGCTLNNGDVPVNQARAWDSDYHMLMERFVAWITLQIEGNVPLFNPQKRYRIAGGCYLKGDEPN